MNTAEIMNKYNDYEVYLFDMDGTLVNSEPLKGLALAKACADYGSTIDSNIYKDVMGESWSVVTDHFFKHAEISPELAEFNVHFKRYYEELLIQKLEPISGVIEFIAHLKSSGKKCGVVSSAATWMVVNILNALNLSEVFDIVITQEHVSKHKPDPEAYQLALLKLGAQPQHTVVFEDSNAGVLAGIGSGCDVIAIKHEFNGKNDLSSALTLLTSYKELYL